MVESSRVIGSFFIIKEAIMDYGVLVYDISSKRQDARNRLVSKIRGIALRINLSVYLVPWAMKPRLDVLIDEANISGAGKVEMIKFDNASKADIDRIARESLYKYAQGIAIRMTKRIKKVEDDANKLAHVKYIAREAVAEAEALAIAFNLTGHVPQMLESLKKLCFAEMRVKDLQDTAGGEEKDAIS